MDGNHNPYFIYSLILILLHYIEVDLRIGFHVYRDVVIKHFAPLIEYLLQQDSEVTIFCDQITKKSQLGFKAYTYPDTNKVPNFRRPIQVLSFKTSAEFINQIKINKIEIMFFVNFPEIKNEIKNKLNENSYFLLTAEMQIFFDLFLTGINLDYTDVIYLYSDNWKSWWEQYLNLNEKKENSCSIIRKLKEKCVSVGFVEFDQCKNYKKEAIYTKYSIPESRKIIVLFPFPWRLPFDVWTHVIFQPQPRVMKFIKLLFYRAWAQFDEINKKNNDYELCRAIKRFAEKNQGYFIVKGRLKNKIPKYLWKMADRIIYDESYYPFTTLELLHLADLSINFYSAAIMESIMTNTPTINIVPNENSCWPGYEKWQKMHDFSMKKDSFYNYDGVVYLDTVKNFIKCFGEKNFDDYRLEKRHGDRFIKKYLGTNDNNASKRIYEDLANRIQFAKLKNGSMTR